MSTQEIEHRTNVIKAHRNRESYLFKQIETLAVEIHLLEGVLEDAELSTRDQVLVREKLKELHHNRRLLKASYIKAAAKLDRARAKMGVEARGVRE